MTAVSEKIGAVLTTAALADVTDTIYRQLSWNPMNIRAGRAEDFTNVRNLVAAAIAEPFYRPDLTPAQRAENQHVIDSRALLPDCSARR
jgi:hypothetical protein